MSRFQALRLTEHLTAHELVLRAQQIGARELATFAALDPPARLSAAHALLLADMRSPAATAPAAYVARERRLEAGFAATGLTVCERYVPVSLAR